MPGEFAWTIGRKAATLGAIIGPDPLEITDDDIFIKPDPDDPMGTVIAAVPLEAVQRFYTLGPTQYAVIFHPSDSHQPDYPNGNFTTGRTKMPALARGRKRVVTSGHFPIWPGQRVEVRDVHRLSTSEYLVAVVESAEVDPNAPYYVLTAQCARIRKAVVDETVASKDKVKGQAEVIQPAVMGPSSEEQQGEGQEGGERVQAGGESTTPPDHLTVIADRPADEPIVFTVGQRIIIPGNMTPTYIPPSGIEVLFETEEAAKPESVEPWDVISDRIATGVLKIENLRTWLANAGLPEDYYARVEEQYLLARRSGQADTALYQGLRTLQPTVITRLAEVLRRAAVKPPKKDTAIRQAVVLGPTQFCVLLDEDGRPQTKEGAGRVFPGPWDHFRTEGSDDRIYQAYHLRTDRGILLRVVANISREELQQQLPQGTKLEASKENYVKGDEIFIGGFDAYFVPSSAIEVINPKTRQPHIGNKHSDAYVVAIGVDQKSGVYVADVDTGNVALRRGETKLLLDPRREQHVIRRVPAEMWNLWIGRGEPHKKAAPGTMVETPWALSIMVPNNEAILVTSKDGRRAFVGPGTTLLQYEEILEVLTLSRGKMKTDADQLPTCFLRVIGNRISDTILLETADFVGISVAVSYGVTFVGNTDEERVKWFNHKDYVMLLAENMRSRLRAAARQLTLKELYPRVADFVRDTVLGVKPEGEGQHRPGHLFEENNMMVTEVEVLSIQIPDAQVAQSLTSANRQIVTLEIDGKAEDAKLAAARRDDRIDQEKAGLTLGQIERKEEVQRAQNESDFRIRSEAEERRGLVEKAAQDFGIALEKMREDAADVLADLRRAREEKDTASEAAVLERSQKLAAEFRERLAATEKDLMDAAANADKTRFEAIQDGLVEALEGLGDKQVLTQLAATLPPATGGLGRLFGLGGLRGLIEMLGDSPFAKALARVCENAATVAKKNVQATSAGGTGEEESDSR